MVVELQHYSGKTELFFNTCIRSCEHHLMNCFFFFFSVVLGIAGVLSLFRSYFEKDGIDRLFSYFVTGDIRPGWMGL